MDAMALDTAGPLPVSELIFALRTEIILCLIAFILHYSLLRSGVGAVVKGKFRLGAAFPEGRASAAEPPLGSAPPPPHRAALTKPGRYDRFLQAVSVYHKGVLRELQWTSQFDAIATLVSWGLLDESSASFLLKASEAQAKEILASLGPEARNPSAIVTKKVKDLQQCGSLPYDELLANSLDVLCVHCNGFPRDLKWESQSQAVKTLVSWGVLDDSSANFLLKAPEEYAKEIISNLGAGARNPSAVVTKRLNDLEERWLRAGRPEEGSSLVGMTDTEPMARGRAASPPSGQFGCPGWPGGPGASDGLPRRAKWATQEAAAAALLRWGFLDARCAAFLGRSPQERARKILATLGRRPQNPSAFVLAAVEDLTDAEGEAPDLQASSAGEDARAAPLRQVVRQLLAWGVLEGAGAARLKEASDSVVQQVLAMHGPEAKEAALGVARKLQVLELEVDSITIYCEGEPRELKWISQEQAARTLVAWGVLDERSARFLMKVNERQAKEVLSSLKASARNPSAIVTRKVKELQALSASGNEGIHKA